MTETGVVEFTFIADISFFIMLVLLLNLFNVLAAATASCVAIIFVNVKAFVLSVTRDVA